MPGYFSSDQDNTGLRRLAFGGATALGVAGYLSRREIETWSLNLAQNSPFLQTLTQRSLQTLQGLSNTLSRQDTRLGRLFQSDPRALFSPRADYLDVTNLLERSERILQNRETSAYMTGYLRSIGWAPEKIDVLLGSTTFLKGIIGSQGGSASLIQENIKRSLEGAGSKLSDFLIQESGESAFEQSIQRAAVDLFNARQYARRSIQPGFRDLDSGMSHAIRSVYAEHLRTSSGPTYLERLFGFSRQRVSPDAVSTIRGFVGRSGIGLDFDSLRTDWKRGLFEDTQGTQYDLSGYFHLFERTKNLLAERIIIPMSPGSLGLTLGQFAPFFIRQGNRPFSAILEEGYGQDEVKLFLGGRVISYSETRDEAQISEGSYTAIKAKNQHLQAWLDAENELRNQRAEGVPSRKIYNPIARLGRKAGTIPYWDTPAALLRKFTSREYLPNLLSNAARGGLTSNREARRLVTALGDIGEAGLQDTALVHLYDRIRNLPAEPGSTRRLIRSIDPVDRVFGQEPPHINPQIHKIVDRLRQGHGDTYEKFADIIEEVHGFYENQKGGSDAARVRSWTRTLLPMSRQERTEWLRRTADYSESRRVERLFGLDNFLGQQRYTQLDILRAELFSNTLQFGDLDLSDLGSFFQTQGDHAAALLVHARAIEQRLSETSQDINLGYRRVNQYLQGVPGLSTFLRKESATRRNLLDLQPGSERSFLDFDTRNRHILIEEGRFSLRRVFKSLFGEETSRGLATHSSVFAYFWPYRIMQAFEDQLGVQLSPFYKASAGRLLAGTALVFGSLLLLPEAHKLANRIARDVPGLGFLSLDRHRANLLSLAGRATHRGSWRQRITSILPGLEWYLDPKTEEDQRLYERGAGYTPVRKGRWWLFGSKEAIFGPKVSYYLPSPERLARSDWQAAANVDKNSWRYWMHWGGQLNPANWFGGRYWWETAHRKDRPYVVSGRGFLKPRRILRPEYLPKRLGGTLEQQANRATDPLNTLTPGLSPSYYLPRGKKVRDPSRDALIARINAARRVKGVPPLTKSQPISPEERNYLSSLGFSGSPDELMYRAEEFGGLYGYLLSLLNKGIGHPAGRVEVEGADRGYGRENDFYQQELGGLGGTLSDILRRFIPHRRRNIQDYNPVPNQMPSWLPEELKRGDPYSRLPFGEVRLPGDAYERTHPGTVARMMRMRASSLGKTQEEIEAYLKNKAGDGFTSRAAELGTEMHRVLQQRWRQLGILEVDELQVYNQEMNVTGHIDAILRMPNQMGRMERVIVDIKTKNAERFAAIKKSGTPEEENLDQIQFYMHTTGIHQGLLTYVNRDDPDHETYQIKVKYNRRRVAQIEKRLQAARRNVYQAMERGDISRGDLYDTVTRYEILSDVGARSPEFQNLKSIVNKSWDSYTEEEQARIQAANERRKKIQDGFELHPYQFLNLKARLNRVKATLAQVDESGVLTDTEGRRYRLAGLSTQPKDNPYLNFETLLQKEVGLKIGDRFTAYTESQNEDRVRDAAIFANQKNVGKRLLNIGFAQENSRDNSAASVVNRYSNLEIFIGRLWESFSHLDTPLHTKFLPVRSGLEEYERSDVYGKRSGSWDTPFSSFVWPTLASLTNKTPITGALFGAGLAALFFPFTKERRIAALFGAGIGIGLSVFGVLSRASGKPFIPRAVQKRRELDTYYDMLTYIKYRRLAAQEEEEAKKEEGTDVESVERGALPLEAQIRLEKIQQRRESLEQERKILLGKLSKNNSTRSENHIKSQVQYLGHEIGSLESQEEQVRKENRPLLKTHTQLALLYRQRYRATLRGALEGKSSWGAILSALPKTNRSAILSVIEHGSSREKRRLYDLLPEDQKAVLGYRLGIDPRKIPGLPSLEDYFRNRPLPGINYQGWNDDISLDNLKTKDIKDQHLDPMDFGIYPAQVDEAEQGSPESLLRTPTQAGRSDRSHSQIQQKLHDLLRGKGITNISVSIQEVPPGSDQDSHEADIQINVKHDRTHEIFQKHKRLRSSNAYS